MGKRKSTRKPKTKVKSKLATVFDCVYCSHEKSVDVKLDRSKGVGVVNCSVCQARWQTTINGLSAAIDVYSDWIDACEGAAAAVAQSSVYTDGYQDDLYPQQYADDDEQQEFDPTFPTTHHHTRQPIYDEEDTDLMLDESLG